MFNLDDNFTALIINIAYKDLFEPGTKVFVLLLDLLNDECVKILFREKETINLDFV